MRTCSRQPERGAVAHAQAVFPQQPQPQRRGGADPHQQEVGGGLGTGQSQARELLRQVAAAGPYRPAAACDVSVVGQRGDSGGLRRGVHAPTGLPAPYLPHHGSWPQQVSESQSGERVVLGHRPQQHHVAQAQQPGGVPAPFHEGRVGFVQHQQAGVAERRGDRFQVVRSQVGAGGVVRVAQEQQGRTQRRDAPHRRRQIPAEGALLGGSEVDRSHPLQAARRLELAEGGAEDRRQIRRSAAVRGRAGESTRWRRCRPGCAPAPTRRDRRGRPATRRTPGPDRRPGRGGAAPRSPPATRRAG